MRKVTAYECESCGNIVADHYPRHDYNSEPILACEGCWDDLSDKFAEVCLHGKTL